MSKATVPAGYRELTHAEIIKLGQEMDARQTWRELRELIFPIYGDQAVFVDIETEAEYDDEGGTYDRISDITIQDANEERIEPDCNMNAPWAQEELKREPGRWDHTLRILQARIRACKAEDLPIPATLQEDIEEYLHDAAEDDDFRDQIRDILPSKAGVYDLREEPAVSHALVLVPIGAEQEGEA